MQGYEVMADEAFDQMATKPTHIFLQTGVGGMAAAVAALAKRRWGADRPWIILADPTNAACWVESFRKGVRTAIDDDLDTLMAGLACGECSLLAWEILSVHADAAIAVPDEIAVSFMKALAQPTTGDPPCVAGKSAVAGFGALELAMTQPAVRAALGLDETAQILIFGTEGDTDPDLFQQIVGLSGSAVRARAA